MSEVQIGTKETIDLITLAGVIAGLLVKEVKGDGIQISDALKIVMSLEFRDKLASAVSGISQVPRELADLSKIEALDIARALLDTTVAIVQSIEGRRAA